MSKELTTLQAFENIIVDLSLHLINANVEEIKIVKTALDELEEYKSILKDFGLENPQNLIDNLNIIKDSKFHEKLKALEIIKEKKWLVEDILNAFIEDKEKYELLKEMLL